MFMRDEDKGKSIALRISEFLPVIWLARRRPVVAWLIFNASSVSSGYQMSIFHHHQAAWCLSVPVKAFVTEDICSSSIEPHQWRSQVRNLGCRADEISFLRNGLTVTMMMRKKLCIHAWAATHESNHRRRGRSRKEEKQQLIENWYWRRSLFFTMWAAQQSWFFSRVDRQARNALILRFRCSPRSPSLPLCRATRAENATSRSDLAHCRQAPALLPRTRHAREKQPKEIHSSEITAHSLITSLSILLDFLGTRDSPWSSNYPSSKTPGSISFQWFCLICQKIIQITCVSSGRIDQSVCLSNLTFVRKWIPARSKLFEPSFSLSLAPFVLRYWNCVPVPSSRQPEQSTRKSKHSNQGYREKRILMSFQSVLLNNDPNLDEEGCSETIMSEDWLAERWTSRIFASDLMSLASKTLFTEVKKGPERSDGEKERTREEKEN